MNTETENEISIFSLKYDNSRQYEWKANIIEQTDTYILTIAEPGRRLFHHSKNKIFTFDSWAIEFFPFNEWFTASISVEAGTIKDYYCNICMPPKLNSNILSFIDLDLDYINFNGEWTVVDQDEFAENQIKYKYPDELIERTKLELVKLIEKIQTKTLPFDGTFERYLPLE